MPELEVQPEAAPECTSLSEPQAGSGQQLVRAQIALKQVLMSGTWCRESGARLDWEIPGAQAGSSETLLAGSCPDPPQRVAPKATQTVFNAG